MSIAAGVRVKELEDAVKAITKEIVLLKNAIKRLDDEKMSKRGPKVRGKLDEERTPK